MRPHSEARPRLLPSGTWDTVSTAALEPGPLLAEDLAHSPFPGGEIWPQVVGPRQDPWQSSDRMTPVGGEVRTHPGQGKPSVPGGTGPSVCKHLQTPGAPLGSFPDSLGGPEQTLPLSPLSPSCLNGGTLPLITTASPSHAETLWTLTSSSGRRISTTQKCR